jgi:hypothetical protein
MGGGLMFFKKKKQKSRPVFVGQKPSTRPPAKKPVAQSKKTKKSGKSWVDELEIFDAIFDD